MWPQALLTSPAGWVQNWGAQKEILKIHLKVRLCAFKDTKRHKGTLNPSRPLVHSNPRFHQPKKEKKFPLILSTEWNMNSWW